MHWLIHAILEYGMENAQWGPGQCPDIRSGQQSPVEVQNFSLTHYKIQNYD